MQEQKEHRGEDLADLPFLKVTLYKVQSIFLNQMYLAQFDVFTLCISKFKAFKPLQIVICNYKFVNIGNQSMC